MNPRISLLPDVLHAASIERINEAHTLLQEARWALSMYVSGLAVECLLQAFALRSGAEHEAKHDLIAWLKRCPDRLRSVIQAKASSEWSMLNTIWSNRLRYLSEAGLLGYLRHRTLERGIKGGRASILKVNASRLLDCARVLHNKGVVLWHRS